MTAPKLSFSEHLIAGVAAAPYKPVDVGKAIRRTIWSVGVCVVLFMAARDLDGWLSIAMWVLLALRVLPFLLTGLMQKVVDERKARLELLTPMERHIITTTTQLARHFGRAA